ncbi:hypothetical protein IFT62_03885 [Pseudomonas lutea]|uniref:Uncharacterized protein n=1 Tax=Pseudomonas lutea TaxID=243924 RepID=A0ABR9A2S2_9PSED|nr:hypothetical protein [Pseudomonas lutea]MBD8120344.1 hypothetical protein [Pseudomonas lutea]
MDQLPFHDDGCPDAVSVYKPARGITEDDADKTRALRRSAGKVTGDGHWKVLFHCGDNIRRHQYWIDTFPYKLAF